MFKNFLVLLAIGFLILVLYFSPAAKAEMIASFRLIELEEESTVENKLKLDESAVEFDFREEDRYITAKLTLINESDIDSGRMSVICDFSNKSRRRLGKVRKLVRNVEANGQKELEIRLPAYTKGRVLTCYLKWGSRVIGGSQIDVLVLKRLMDMDASDRKRLILIKKIKKLISKESYYRNRLRDFDEDDDLDDLLDQLGDTRARLYSSDELEDYHLAEAGVGIDIVRDELGQVRVSWLQAGGPAKKVGMRVGDVIMAIDNFAVLKNGDLLDLQKRIRGESGEILSLLVNRNGLIVNFSVKRKTAVSGGMEFLMEDGIYYFKIPVFDAANSQSFVSQLQTISSHSYKGMIIDLRNNPGGSFENILDNLEQFVPKGEVMMWLNQYGGISTVLSEKKMTVDVPVVILVNENTASGAEIFARVLQESALAVLVGKNPNSDRAILEYQKVDDNHYLGYTRGFWLTNEEMISDDWRSLRVDYEMEDDYESYLLDELLVKAREIVGN